MPSRKIAWDALDHTHKDKSSDWFWVVGIVAIAGTVLAVFFSNLLLGVIILLGAFTAIIQARSEQQISHFEITRQGVRIDDLIYPYSNLESFWVIDEEVDDVILIRSRSVLTPMLVIPFDSAEIDAELIREYLLEYMDEEELSEPLGQRLMEMFGF